MRKLLVVYVLLLITYLITTVVKNENTKENRMVLVKNSYQTGCIDSALETCMTEECYEYMIDFCEKGSNIMVEYIF